MYKYNLGEDNAIIYESYPWKQDLLLHKDILVDYNTIHQLEKNDEEMYTRIEKSIFYSAFIIRKLLDCHSKLSDEADNYTLIVSFIKVKKKTKWSKWIDEETQECEKTFSKKVKARDVCNWLIHSHFFFCSQNEESLFTVFFVASDYDKDKCLYKINFEDWIGYIDFIATDSIVKLDSKFDNKNQQYVYTHKVRG